MGRRLGLVAGRAQLAALVAVACAAAAGGMAWHAGGRPLVVERAQGPGAEATADEATPASEATGAGVGERPEVPEGGEEAQRRYLVHVDGAVAAPGVVELTGADVRVIDAVSAAGGLLGDADTTAINLAEPLSDGAKIRIPHEGEAPEAAPTPVGQAQTSGATGSGEATSLVNINSASPDELTSLPGVGEVTAAAIVEERERGGPFAVPEDLMRVSGIGEKRFAKLQGLICV